MKLTKKIKKEWLAALKGGEYKQGFAQLRTNSDGSHCCLGVLACVKGWEIDKKGDCLVGRAGYNPFRDLLGEKRVDRLYQVNDSGSRIPEYPRDYSNVIPIIKSFPTID